MQTIAQSRALAQIKLEAATAHRRAIGRYLQPDMPVAPNGVIALYEESLQREEAARAELRARIDAESEARAQVAQDAGLIPQKV